MIRQTMRTWAEISLGNLEHNYRALRACAPNSGFLGVVKANAYGHGAVPIARALSRLGIRSFCVATAEEGAELRRHHIPGDILILGFTPVEELSLVRRYDLIQTVVDWDYARQLSRLGAPIRVHVAVDTGMHRLGERWENLERIWAIFSMEHLQVEGMFTHLCADDTDKPQACAICWARAKLQYGSLRLPTSTLRNGKRCSMTGDQPGKIWRRSACSTSPGATSNAAFTLVLAKGECAAHQAVSMQPRLCATSTTSRSLSSTASCSWMDQSPRSGRCQSCCCTRV